MYQRSDDPLPELLAKPLPAQPVYRVVAPVPSHVLRPHRTKLWVSYARAPHMEHMTSRSF
jgi:hypothetical protein